VEQFKNNATTTLSGTVNNSSDPVSVSVASASAFPTAGNFRILIGTEILLVTAVSGTTFTASRAQEGTAIASHASSDPVRLILTAASLDQTIKDRITTGVANNYDAENAWVYQATNVPVAAVKQTHMWYAPVAPINESNIAGYTWFNQSTSTISNDGPFSSILSTPSASANVRGLMTTWTAGQSVECWVNPACYVADNSSTLAVGICLGNNSDDKKFSFYVRFRVSGGFPIYDIIRDYWSNNTTGAGSSTAQFVLPQNPFLLRITESSGTATLKYSTDGVNFNTHEAYAYSGNFTATRAGIACFNNTGKNQPTWFHNFRIF
jgi:hypothetical protein